MDRARLSGAGRRSVAESSGRPDTEAAAAAATADFDYQGDPSQMEVIDANDVLRALKAFVEEHNKHRVRQVALAAFLTTVL